MEATRETARSQGWEYYADDLARDVRVSASRARADFGRCVSRGNGLIERRPATEELRLAISLEHVEIRRDDGDVAR